ncbi:MAG TPA: hypothetical protein VLL25_03610, partial [Acidimicrobiales bacterium]|nr:hypothetical protein [Acidimicrobiales bacterium]
MTAAAATVAVVPRRAGSLRLLIWTPLAAAGVLMALITGRPELVVLAAPFAVTLIVGLVLVQEPVFTVDVSIDTVRMLQGDNVWVEVRVASSVELARVEVMLSVPSGLSVMGANSPQNLSGREATSRRWPSLPRRAGGGRELSPKTSPKAAATAISLPAGTERSLRWRLRAERWGAFRIGTVTVRGHDRSGLLVWTATCDRNQPLRALPSAGTLRALVQPHQTLVTAGNVVDRTKG